jgi:hypothetical protein
MKALTGHITATEKKAIKAILAAGLTSGRVGRTDYRISNENGLYLVFITKLETPWCETKAKLTTNKHTFTL